eukprot:403341555
MEDKPFKFDPVNPRLVTNAQKNNTVYYGAAAIFLISLRAYHRRVFRIDQNSLNLAGFTAASALASYSYASFFLDSAENEAGLINNDKELQRA